MKHPNADWKKWFNQELYSKLERLPDAKMYIDKYVSAWQALRVLIREVSEGTDLEATEDEFSWSFITRTGKTELMKAKYLSLHFAGSSVGFYPYGITQDVKDISKYPGFIGTAHISQSADLDFMRRNMLYLFEKPSNQLVWLYTKVSKPDWNKVDDYGVFDSDILKRILEANFLG